MADPRDAVLSLKQISISFPKGTSEAQAQARAGEFARAMQSAKGCGAVDQVAGAARGLDRDRECRVHGRVVPPSAGSDRIGGRQRAVPSL
jgi:peptidyl-prolyl cis-trans isomerase SurA